MTSTTNETISLTARASVPAKVLTQEIDGQTAILHLESDCYYGLDDVGTEILRAVTSCGSMAEAIDELVEIYDVERERLQEDVLELVARLRENGLLEVD